MRWRGVALALLLATRGALLAQESDGPHRMLKPDGETDMEKCAACHESDLSLSRSKRETCTLCHAETLHAGAYVHLHASPDKLKQLLNAAHEEKPQLPTADDGGIFCGTCHLFHDPRLTEEKPLATRREAPSAFDTAVQRAIEAQWPAIAQKYDAEKADASFAAKATKALRLPVDDGTLCRRCHGNAPR
jgi:hypothetical protein